MMSSTNYEKPISREQLKDLFQNNKQLSERSFSQLIDATLNRADDQFHGVWKKGRTYHKGDIVIHNHRLWQMIKANPICGEEPSEKASVEKGNEKCWDFLIEGDDWISVSNDGNMDAVMWAKGDPNVGIGVGSRVGEYPQAKLDVRGHLSWGYNLIIKLPEGTNPISLKALPSEGTFLVAVAQLRDTYHARIFNKAGEKIFDGAFSPSNSLIKALEDAVKLQSKYRQIKSNLISKITSESAISVGDHSWEYNLISLELSEGETPLEALPSIGQSLVVVAKSKDSSYHACIFDNAGKRIFDKEGISPDKDLIQTVEQAVAYQSQYRRVKSGLTRKITSSLIEDVPATAGRWLLFPKEATDTQQIFLHYEISGQDTNSQDTNGHSSKQKTSALITKLSTQEATWSSNTTQGFSFCHSGIEQRESSVLDRSADQDTVMMVIRPHDDAKGETSHATLGLNVETPSASLDIINAPKTDTPQKQFLALPTTKDSPTLELRHIEPESKFPLYTSLAIETGEKTGAEETAGAGEKAGAEETAAAEETAGAGETAGVEEKTGAGAIWGTNIEHGFSFCHYSHDEGEDWSNGSETVSRHALMRIRPRGQHSQVGIGLEDPHAYLEVSDRTRPSIQNHIRLLPIQEEYDSYNLKLVEGIDGLSAYGKNLVLVAKIDDAYHVRVFNTNGDITLDQGSSDFVPDQDLRKALEKALNYKKIDPKTNADLKQKIASCLGDRLQGGGTLPMLSIASNSTQHPSETYLNVGLAQQTAIWTTNAPKGFVFRQQQSDSLPALAQGQSHFTIDADGRIGIGTEQPTARFDIHSPLKSGQFLFDCHLENEQTSTSVAAIVHHNKTEVEWDSDAYLSLGTTVSSEGSHAVLFTDAKDGFTFKSGKGASDGNHTPLNLDHGQPLVHITPTGQLGIGKIPTQSFSLDVQGMTQALNHYQVHRADWIDPETEGELVGVLEKLKQLKPVTFEWTEKSGFKTEGRQIGLRVSELKKVFPEVVKLPKIESSEAVIDDSASISYQNLVPILVQAINELNQQKQNQYNKFQKQETIQYDQFEQKIKQLENRIAIVAIALFVSWVILILGAWG